MVCVLQSKLPRSTAVFSLFIASRFSFRKTFLILAPFFISVYHNSSLYFSYLLFSTLPHGSGSIHGMKMHIPPLNARKKEAWCVHVPPFSVSI